ncbi:MAG: type II toxin-antitoxin system RelE/ParE family toxin [Patescibacteria group bacterium]|nr:type II toxin-antitoxin system RelE/ParE family toxin [Patescibacteria group bacterium]
MFPIEFLPDARRDYDESFDWYSARSVEAAVGFCDAVDSALSQIVANPTRFASPDGTHRECPVKKFPFRIVYRLIENRVLIVAVAHAKRRPRYWCDRR